MTSTNTPLYDEASIRSLNWREHIRLRPGMYIGKLGNGSHPSDGIYVLVKEIIDNAIDEHLMGHGKKIEITVSDHEVSVRDYGRGIPLGKVVECVSMMNTGAKYDTQAFQKSVGLNGVGTKAVNALSQSFTVSAMREGKKKTASFSRGVLETESKIISARDKTGTFVTFTPDEEIFSGYRFRPELLEDMLWNYAYLNTGLTLVCNGKNYRSQEGLKDLLNKKTREMEPCYPIVHIKSRDIEVAFTHTEVSGEVNYSFVNGQYTPMGGTHQLAFRESFIRTLRHFYGKNFETTDIKNGLNVALCVRIQEPVFESQTKTRLGSQNAAPGGPSLKSWFHDFFGKECDLYLHKNPEFANSLVEKIQLSMRERAELSSVKKVARERLKKTDLYNKKLRDSKVHYYPPQKGSENTMIFITEGDSASGSITKSRDPRYQAVFSLRGKPLNSFGMKKKVVYENEEFYLLAHACRLEEGAEQIRYKKIILATDADVDGMHIRLLLLTFFLSFYPEVARLGHLYVLETPLFRVRDGQKTQYCYSEEEKIETLSSFSSKAEVTRFKGLGEISPHEFRLFIGEDMRLSPVVYDPSQDSLAKILNFYMGKNTQERREFIVSRLRERPIESLLKPA